MSANDTGTPTGGLAPEKKGMTNEEIVEEVLNDPTISDEAKQQVLDKVAAAEQLEKNPPMTTRSPTSPMIQVTPIKQETSTWCAAATIQQTLNRINGSVGASQSSVMASVGDGPSLQTVLNYINARQSKNNYIRVSVSDESDLLNKLYIVEPKGTPMVFTMSNQHGAAWWPYTTGGHFTNLKGKYCTTYYQFADPYYYPEWCGKGNGHLDRTFVELWTANGELFAGEGHIVGW